MYFRFRCKGCSGTIVVPFEQISSLWQENYEKRSDKEKKDTHFNLFTTYQCLCGKVNDFRDGLFQYMFEIIFNSMVFKGRRKINS